MASDFITAEYFRSKIEECLQQYPDYKVSENNVYVKGCHIEFDFLILKSDALKQGGVPVYKADDVVAVLECKSNGIYHEYYRGKDDQTQKDTYDLKNFVDAYLKLLKENKQIKMGYIIFPDATFQQKRKIYIVQINNGLNLYQI